RQLAERVRLVDADPDLPSDQSRRARVCLETFDGRWSINVAHAWGDPQRPMDNATLTGKFHQLADPVLGRTNAAQVATRAASLDESPDLRDLTDLLPPAPTAGAVAARSGRPASANAAEPVRATLDN